jgi:hypothetical protein
MFLFVGVLLLAGCAANHAPAGGTDPDQIVSAEIMRWKDSLGIMRNDKQVLTDPGQLQQLEAFFPDLNNQSTSGVHGGWSPWIVVRFHRGGGKVTYVFSEYRIYRVDDSSRGDFVMAPGFEDYADKLFSQPALGPSTPK